jgi:MoxR-like ATPase
MTTDKVIERMLKDTPTKEGELTSDPRFQKIFAA